MPSTLRFPDRDHARSYRAGRRPSARGQPVGLPAHFCLDDDDAYRRWRDRKLRAHLDERAGEIVEVGDPRQLSLGECDAVKNQCRATNLAVYACTASKPMERSGIRLLGCQLGLERLHRNPCAGEDGIAAIRVERGGRRQEYIPYTDRPLNWHTDGYYNRARDRIRGVVMHCVRPAPRGGDNAFLDPEIAYIYLREEDPSYVAALMQPDVMTIPANMDGARVVRPACTGPVFSIDLDDGTLHMRYTARQRSIIWKDDAVVKAATACLLGLLGGALVQIRRIRLEAGQGVICNNVLHSRSAFSVDTPPEQERLLWRARYLERVQGT